MPNIQVFTPLLNKITNDLQSVDFKMAWSQDDIDTVRRAFHELAELRSHYVKGRIALGVKPEDLAFTMGSTVEEILEIAS